MRDSRPFVALLLLAGAGCVTRDGASRDAAPREPLAVQPVTLRPAEIVRVIEQPGTVRADEQAQLFAKVPGYVSALHADIGREVKHGDPLATLSAPELDEEHSQKQALTHQGAAELRQAVKAEAAARARVTAKEAFVEEARAGLGRADALVLRWQSEDRRMAGLAKQGVIDAQSREEVNNQYKAALAGRDEARARVASASAAAAQAGAEQEKAGADVGAARARLGVAHAAARQSQAMLDYLVVRAPFDGVVSHRQVNTGDLLQSGPGKSVGIFTLVRLDPVRVVVAVPEADAALVRPGMPVKLTLPALRPAARDGRVTRTSWALDPRSRTLQAEIDLPNKDRQVRPGMYVTATLTARVPAAATLPAAAVARQGDDLVAFRLDGDRAVQVVLRTGLRDDKHVDVLEYRRPGEVLWTRPTGKESFVGKLTAELTDGAAVTR